MMLKEIFAQLRKFELAIAPARISARADWSLPGALRYDGTITLAASIGLTWQQEVEGLMARRAKDFPEVNFLAAEHSTDGATVVHFNATFVRTP